MQGKRILMFFSLFLLSMSLAQAQMNRQKPTARAQLEKVTETAKTWSADSQLISVNSNQVNEDGTAAAWTYTFYSKRKDKWNLITAKGREITNLEVPQGSTTAIKDLFADSDVVMETAVANGLKGKSPRMNLSRAGWIVAGGDDPGDVIVTINPASGAYVKKIVVGK
jgi:archaellum component FlaG (FlaF/FlaG flagellin family)